MNQADRVRDLETKLSRLPLSMVDVSRWFGLSLMYMDWSRPGEIEVERMNPEERDFFEKNADAALKTLEELERRKRK